MSTLNCPEEVWLAERLVACIHGPYGSFCSLVVNDAIHSVCRASAGEKLWLFVVITVGTIGHKSPERVWISGPLFRIRAVVYLRIGRYVQWLQLLDHMRLLLQIMICMSRWRYRDRPPDPGFLQAVLIVYKTGIVLIFDECTSGFRETFGGLHLKYGVEPDMAMFGKALGNGYAITATIGCRSVMEAAQSTFISSTFWTERIGPTAALKTLEVMERECSWEKVTSLGTDLRHQWQLLADRYSLRISHNGLPALAGFAFQSPHALAYKTLITQEMLKKGFLAATSCYVSMAHTTDVIEPYIEALDSVFALIADCEAGRSVEELLEGPVCHGGFKRLN